MSVLQFVEDVKQDITSPSSSVLSPKVGNYKSMVSSLDEVQIILINCSDIAFTI